MPHKAALVASMESSPAATPHMIRPLDGAGTPGKSARNTEWQQHDVAHSHVKPHANLPACLPGMLGKMARSWNPEAAVLQGATTNAGSTRQCYMKLLVKDRLASYACTCTFHAHPLPACLPSSPPGMDHLEACIQEPQAQHTHCCCWTISIR